MAAVVRKTKPPMGNQKTGPGGLHLSHSIQASALSTRMLQPSTVNSTPVSQQNVRTLYTSPPENDYGTPFNDPQNVHQWAVSIANGSARVRDGVHTGYSNVNYGNDACYDSSGTGHHLRYPSDSHPSTFAVFPSEPSTMQAPSMRQTVSDGLYDAHSTNLAAFETGIRFLSPDFIDAKISAGEFPNCETWIPGEMTCHSSLFPTDLARGTSGDSYQSIASEYNENTPFPATWREEQLSMEEHFTDGLIVDPSEAWSPSAVTMDLSISSSCSQGSYTMQYDGYPPSFGTQEDLSQVSHQSYSTSPLDMDTQARFPHSVGSFENSFETQSTTRPVRTCERQCLDSAVFYPEEDPSHYYSNMANPLDEANIRRNCNGEESKCTARRDQLYKLGPQKDGLYHCPFATNCSHKPDKLKCNYDKHLDSHLKPYRCKVHACVNVAFSSTACLLRHEREAHGMHGHGDKPYLCRYEDCDRSIEGNGFPRRWNLLDHMKRVHSDSGPSSAGCASPSTSSASSPPSTKVIIASRKKRLTSAPEIVSIKRPKPSRAACKLASKVDLEPSLLPKGRTKQQIQKQCQKQQIAVAEPLDGLDSRGLFEYQHMITDYTELDLRLLDVGQVF
ncbi:hypothetical protein MMC17_008566 [Xylographa soralifera]|nr:hypothetical protein [Xylographa soralifera]